MNHLAATQNNQAFDSREVTEMAEKQHNDFLKDIRRCLEQLGGEKITQSGFFMESTYRNSQNKIMTCYLVTRKGCKFIANKLRGVKDTEFTTKYSIVFTP
ncbi:Rha family transcriptional regulator [Anaerotignum sp.]|uniref:Rha family transcriptional regulator n=1 Tax=Anaerotignum sp. TaxID=2039241 RepID=UPI0028AD9ABE|nr:Rha family transcriptional regulator [Anaerotignum sp.]